MKRRLFMQAGLPMLSSAMPMQPLWAQEKYPSKPITLIVAYVPGGSADQRARQLGRFLSTAFKQTVIVDNRPGAHGNIGTHAVVRAPADGYTLGIGNLGPVAVNPHLFPRMPFKPLSDLTLIALIERGPLMLVVRRDSPYRNVADLLAGARSKPGGLSFGSSGTGSAHHLAGELLKSITGANVTHIPYKGGAAAMFDLYGGQLDFVFEPMYSALPALRAEKLTALAITSADRSPVAKDVPTMQEAGVKGFTVDNWQGLIGPAGMPPSLVNLLNETVNSALADSTIRAQMLAQGNEVGGGAPEQFSAHVRAESERWRQLIAHNKIMAE